jgi:hypothetical protein
MTIAAGLAALADEELALVLDGRVEELEALAARRDVLLGALTPAAGADPAQRPDLEHALRTHALAAQALREHLSDTAAQLGALRSRRTAAQGYRNSTNV